MNVVALRSECTHDLRRRVLYGHWPAAPLRYPTDDVEGTFHLGVVDDSGDLVAISSWHREPAPPSPDRPAYRLRGMAVEPQWQGTGAGRLLFQAGIEEARRRGAELLWANARDTALSFYQRAGMQVVGEGFNAAGGLPHHVVVLEL